MSVFNFSLLVRRNLPRPSASGSELELKLGVETAGPLVNYCFEVFASLASVLQTISGNSISRQLTA